MSFKTFGNFSRCLLSFQFSEPRNCNGEFNTAKTLAFVYNPEQSDSCKIM